MPDSKLVKSLLDPDCGLPPSLPRESTPGERIAWIREAVRLYAGHLAAEALVGAEPYPGANSGELLLACAGLGGRVQAIGIEPGIAWREEWETASTRALELLEAMRRAIWPLGRMQASGQQILRVARDVNHRFGWLLPEDLLVAEAKRIATAAAPHKGRRRARFRG